MTHNQLILGLAVFVVVLIIISLIKKIAKVVIFLLVGVLAFFVVNLVISNKTPAEMVSSTKTDAIYTKEIYSYTGKIKSSADNTLKAIENKDIPKLKEENENLHKYFDEVSKLQHGKELDSFHEKYCDYLKSIMSTSDTAVKSGDFVNGTTKSIEEVESKLNKALDGLSNMKITP